MQLEEVEPLQCWWVLQGLASSSVLLDHFVLNPPLNLQVLFDVLLQGVSCAQVTGVFKVLHQHASFDPGWQQ